MGLVPKSAGPYPVRSTAGRRTVSYRDSKGVTRDAVVVGGTGTTLDLSIRQGGGGTRKVEGVEKRTGLKQTNVWW